MSTGKLLEDLSAQQVKLWVEDDRLQCQGPKHALTPEFVKKIQAHKADLLRLLKERAEKPAPHRLSYGQQSLWYHYQLAPNSPAYNLSCIAGLQADLNPDSLQQAFETLITRHGVLRTVFTTRDGQAVQQMQTLEQMLRRRSGQRWFNVVEASHWSKTELADWLAAETDRPFNFEQGPLIRITLVSSDSETSTEQENLLVLVTHHIVADFWTLDILLEELCLIYGAIQDGILAQLPYTSLQYADYVQWQAEMLAGRKGVQLRAYWQKQLAGDLPILHLPTDFPRPPVQTYHRGIFEFSLDMGLEREIQNLAKTSETTPYGIFLSALYVLLFRYTGQDDILIGSPVAGRSRQEFEQILGYFVNPVVLRTNLSGNPTGQEAINRVRRTLLAALEHQDYPFQLILEELHLVRNPGIPPVFQVSFSWDQSRRSQELQRSNRTDRQERVIQNILAFEQRGAPFDLNLTIVSSNGRFNGRWQYSADLFQAETMTRMTNHLLKLLQGLTERPDLPIAELPMLSKVEEHQVLVEFSKSPSLAAAEVDSSPPDKTLVDLFEEQAARTPDAIAVECDKRQITYQELNARANQAAHVLCEMYQVQPEDLVGLLLSRSEWMIVGILGVLKTGAAYVPLDAQYPPKRLGFILEDSACKVVLSEAELPNLLNSAGQPAAVADIHQLSHSKTGNPGCFVLPRFLAYVIYTSGSTGIPKGVTIEHRSVVHLMHGLYQHIYQRYASAPALRVALMASFGFDASVQPIFSSLCNGYTLVVVNDALKRDGQHLNRFFQEQQLDITNCTPTLIEIMAAAEGFVEVKRQLKHLLIGGEAFSPALAETLAGDDNSVNVSNVYGPTEACVDATLYNLPVNLQMEKRTVPIGNPLPHIQVLILDPGLHPVAVGVPGEICLTGIGLARGYLNRPALTREKFIPFPFPTPDHQKGARLYRTGDLGRWRPDGAIEFLGRLDSQVKIRGYRIELGEIEERLRQHETVQDAVVVAKDFTETGSKELAAYIITHEELRGKKEELTVHDLHEYLQQTLPDYMIPSYFIQLDVIPLTIHGKLDYRALPVPSEAGMAGGTTYFAPRDKIERQLAQIWQEILLVPKVGIRDNFFALGGHSLKAIQIAIRVQQALGNELSLQTFFRHPTVETQAEHLRAQRPSIFVPIEPAPPASFYPVSHAQRRLWVLNQLDRDSAAYNMPGAFMLEGELNREAFSQSIDALVERHESLRTVFPTVDDEPVQRILDVRLETSPSTGLGPHNRQSKNDWTIVTYVDLTNEAYPDERAGELACEDALRSFDLTTGPLMRVSLLKTAKQTHIMLFNMHHIISDGWSLIVLMRELCRFYEYFKTVASSHSSIPSPLPPLRLQYKDFAVWQNRLLEDETHLAHQRYWHNKLSGDISILDLPRDFRRPPVQTFTGNAVYGLLTETQSERLKRFCHQQTVSLFILLLAGFKMLLYRLTEVEDIIVGTPIAGRNYPGLEDQVGFFVNTLALRDRVQGSHTFVDFLQQVKQTATEAYDHQLYLFDKLVDELDLQRDLSRTPLFQVFLNMLNLPEEPESLLEGISMRRFPQTEGGAKFDLTVYAQEQEDRIRFKLVYNTALFRQERMEEMLEQFQNVLCELAANPNKTLDSFSLRTKRAQRVLPDPMQEFHAGHATTLHTLCSQQAQREAELPAVVDADGPLNYRELETLSNQVAHYLKDRGIGHQEVVAIYAHRSSSLVVALLGILKAGAAFLILDSAYPESRLAECVRKAGPQGLIHLEAAGDVPDRVEYCLLRSACSCRLTLPRQLNLVTCEALKGFSISLPEILVQPDDPAYVAFTSGTTGKPRGILGTHRPVGHFLDWHVRTFKLTNKDRFSMLSGLSHDPLLRDIFTPLLLGATLYIPDSADLQSAHQLAAWLRNHQISVMHLTPALGQVLAETPSPGSYPSLRYLFFSGDVLKKTDVMRLRQLTPNASYVNFYGTTETPQAMSAFLIPAHTDLPDTMPLGQGIDGVQLLVLNEAGQLAGIGEPAEIAVRTPYLSKGYLGEESLNRCKFVTNPFTGKYEDRIYRTGDWGRYQSDGTIEFLGRRDAQMKIRGYRIEAGEIEHLLRQHEAVQDAVIIAKDFRKDGDKELVAYVVTSHQDPVSGIQSSVISIQSSLTTVLREHLKRALPDYMVPSYFVHIEKIPLTLNGKIDKQALPDPVETGLQHGKKSLAPRDTLELQIVQLWEEVLEIFPVDVRDNFFDLGGHSMKAVRLMAKIQQLFGKNLPLATLFQSSTIEQLATVLRHETELLSWSSLVAIQPYGANPPFFFVPGTGGNVIYLYALTQCLGREQPFYGLQAVGLDGRTEPHNSIEAMAAHYIECLQTVRPSGPYLLGGHSLGGKVAFEMARQLRQQRHEVALLAIFDTTAPPFVSNGNSVNEARLFCDAAWFYAQSSGKKVQVSFDELQKLSWEGKLHYLQDRLQQVNLLSSSADVVQLHGHIQVYRANKHLRYTPPQETHPIPITLFKACEIEPERAEYLERSGMVNEVSWGWSQYAVQSVDIYEMPGNHFTMMTKPHVQELAKWLKKCLQQALAT
ncbi:MAG: amino acid adenylation domain-containing protein [bacterium]|nr:amino acid adenylation domain-containing protein [bacterium]